MSLTTINTLSKLLNLISFVLTLKTTFLLYIVSQLKLTNMSTNFAVGH